MCGLWWEVARRALVDADPNSFLEIITILDVGTTNAATLSDRLRAAGTRVHLGWTVRTFSDADRYILVAGQEIYL